MKTRTRTALALFLLCLAAATAPAQTATPATAARKAAAQKAAGQSAPAQKAAVPAGWRAALEQISADSMRGHLSFLSSDLLEGRNTPSRGLDIAAEYIAAQFRRAGLEPAGDDGYFATAHMVTSEPNLEGFQLTMSHGESVLTARAKDVAINASAAL